MKKLVRSKSGREIYGPKWQNMEANTSETVNNDSVSIKTTDQIDAPTVAQTNIENNDDQTQSSEGINRRGILSHCHQSMYNATLKDDCVAVEMLLDRDSNLGCDEISEEGDRALHVAATMKHQNLVRKLVERMRPSQLALVDGHGYTACCYAAMSGSVGIADLMMRKNPSLATARDRENKTPLQKAASRGNAEMVSYFLKSAKDEDLSTEEWFDLLLVTIRRNMYGVGLEILRINEQLATMSNDEGTALHLLAKQCFYKNQRQYMKGVMKREMRLLGEKLWAGVQTLGQCSAVELMKKPPILHNAAEVGNIELITMLTHTYPALIWLTDTEGYTIFHIAVLHRHERLFALINEIGARKDLIAVWQDEDGNNILHLVGQFRERRISYMAAFEMQREMLWFRKVQDIVPPLCLEMKNKEGETAKELFSMRHKRMLEESRTWMRNVSDSCMLISTLIFTVVFGSAFAVPGGYDDKTGIPILLGTHWFTCFVIFEALAMLSSGLSILCFLRIMMINMNETHFAGLVPFFFVCGLNALAISVLAGVSVFMSAYFLVFVGKWAVLVVILIIVVYVVFLGVVSLQIYALYYNLPKYRFRKLTQHTLFK